jgi:hypothetical protein
MIFAVTMQTCAKGHTEICYLTGMVALCPLCAALDELGAATDQLAELVAQSRAPR